MNHGSSIVSPTERTNVPISEDAPTYRGGVRPSKSDQVSSSRTSSYRRRGTNHTISSSNDRGNYRGRSCDQQRSSANSWRNNQNSNTSGNQVRNRGKPHRYQPRDNNYSSNTHNYPYNRKYQRYQGHGHPYNPQHSPRNHNYERQNHEKRSHERYRSEPNRDYSLSQNSRNSNSGSSFICGRSHRNPDFNNSNKQTYRRDSNNKNYAPDRNHSPDREKNSANEADIERDISDISESFSNLSIEKKNSSTPEKSNEQKIEEWRESDNSHILEISNYGNKNLYQFLGNFSDDFTMQKISQDTSILIFNSKYIGIYG
eukprot:TRINITY_DN9278_c0_g1_i2.p1 TRINITY_DN9278_c0_g1~~TRINITY_DN9278_c0_g1_i2.p1  ORF type:complete len:314 (+),score=51.00 TRINITY_DN9278_c0_g1_i2:51-992(+)